MGVKLGVAEGPRVSGQLGMCCDLLSQKYKQNKTEAKGSSIAAPESVSLDRGQGNQMTKLFCGNIHVAPDGVLVALSVDRPGASSAASRPVPCAHQEHAAPSPSPVFIQVSSPQQAAVTSLYRTV